MKKLAIAAGVFLGAILAALLLNTRVSQWMQDFHCPPHKGKDRRGKAAGFLSGKARG